jgi:hypothetical protein
MALSIELLKQMEGPHAINALRADFDPLVNTPLEAFLIDWLEELVDDDAGSRAFIEVAENHDIEAKDFEALADALIEDTGTTVALLGVLGEASIYTADTLKAELNLATSFSEIAKDAGDVFTRLNELTTTAQE